MVMEWKERVTYYPMKAYSKQPIYKEDRTSSTKNQNFSRCQKHPVLSFIMIPITSMADRINLILSLQIQNPVAVSFKHEQ